MPDFKIIKRLLGSQAEKCVAVIASLQMLINRSSDLNTVSEERVLSVLSDPRSFLFPSDAFEGEKKKKKKLV